MVFLTFNFLHKEKALIFKFRERKEKKGSNEQLFGSKVSEQLVREKKILTNEGGESLEAASKDPL